MKAFKKNEDSSASWWRQCFARWKGHPPKNAMPIWPNERLAMHFWRYSQIIPGIPSTQHHKIIQHPAPPSLLSPAIIAALVAASNTSSTPSPVKLEHSRYFRAPMTSFISLPSLYVVNLWLFFRISSWAIGSSLRSFFNATSMIGTPGHRSRASSAHLCLTFSSESGVSTLKPMRMTCAFEYASGLSRS